MRVASGIRLFGGHTLCMARSMLLLRPTRSDSHMNSKSCLYSRWKKNRVKCLDCGKFPRTTEILHCDLLDARGQHPSRSRSIWSAMSAFPQGVGARIYTCMCKVKSAERHPHTVRGIESCRICSLRWDEQACRETSVRRNKAFCFIQGHPTPKSPDVGHPLDRKSPSGPSAPQVTSRGLVLRLITGPDAAEVCCTSAGRLNSSNPVIAMLALSSGPARVDIVAGIIFSRP